MKSTVIPISFCAKLECIFYINYCIAKFSKFSERGTIISE